MRPGAAEDRVCHQELLAAHTWCSLPDQILGAADTGQLGRTRTGPYPAAEQGPHEDAKASAMLSHVTGYGDLFLPFFLYFVCFLPLYFCPLYTNYLYFVSFVILLVFELDKHS